AFLGTIRRATATPDALTIELQASVASRLKIPETVVIPAGATQVDFAMNIVDNSTVDGDTDVVVDAYGIYPRDGARILASQSSRTVTVSDDDGPTLTVSLDRQFVGEGISGAAQGTVRRNTATHTALTVSLASNLESEATVPLQVTIPIGAETATFSIDTVADGLTDGTRQVTLTASAAAFSTGSALLSVSDQNVPDLVISELSTVATSVTEAVVDVEFRVRNDGLSVAAGTLTQTVYLSSDPVPGDDLLVGSYPFTGTLQPTAPLNSFSRTIPVRLPREAGNYWVIVVTDSLDTVLEGVESNNTRVSAQPIEVLPAYHATVETATVQAFINTPVVLSGTARNTLTNAPEPYAMVAIDLTLRGIRRTIAAITDANGDFRATFLPLFNEAGLYQIAARHPGAAEGNAQDQFSLIGLGA
ncbi:MAG: CARDB domain-containing protein, partial [Planctomycetaceae bacterium]